MEFRNTVVECLKQGKPNFALFTCIKTQIKLKSLVCLSKPITVKLTALWIFDKGNQTRTRIISQMLQKELVLDQIFPLPACYLILHCSSLLLILTYWCISSICFHSVERLSPWGSRPPPKRSRDKSRSRVMINGPRSETTNPYLQIGLLFFLNIEPCHFYEMQSFI